MPGKRARQDRAASNTRSLYRVLDEQFEVSGGSYEILREGINK